MATDRLESQPQVSRASGATWLAVALVVTFAARAIPSWRALGEVWRDQLRGDAVMSYELFHDLVLLGLGACLALSAPRRSGLRIGAVRDHWRAVLLVCAVPVLATALVYPNLPERPFAGSSWSMWLISPLAQDLVFIGFLYGQLDRVFPGHVHPRVPVSRALVLTAAFFALWHVPNISGVSAGYLLFQLAYTSAGLIVAGLSRQWTGSIVYCTMVHSAVNLIAWSVN